jgi:hypothetical protein
MRLPRLTKTGNRANTSSASLCSMILSILMVIYRQFDVSCP